MAKAYYECPVDVFVDFEGLTTALPILGPVVDKLGGQWKVVEQDSDTDPSSAILAVSDRLGPDDPPNPEVHQECRRVGRFLGKTLEQARNAARPVVGSVRAARMLDQTVGGE